MSTKFNQHLQDSVLHLAITEDDFIKLVAGRMKPKFFTSRLTENIAQLCFAYYEQFKEAPKDHFHDELVRLIADKPDDECEEYIKYVTKLNKLSKPNQQYVLNRINDFIKMREREIALVDAADLVAEGRVEAADNLLYQALQSGIKEEDAGLDYFTTFSSLDQRESSILTPTGIAALDSMIGGYRRGQLAVTLGGYKGGKTWSLMHLAKTALMHGLNVLHISNEVSLRVTETRYDMMFTGRGTYRIGESVQYYKFKNDKLIRNQREIKNVYDKTIIEKARKRVQRFGGNLRIKKYPMGKCSPAEVERYLHYLETYENFVPDVLIIDYVDIMDLSGYSKEVRHQLNSAYIWAKGLADERNILVATVSQVTRDALKRKHVRQKDVAEDIRKVGNVDVMLAIGRDDAAVANNTASMNVIANREGIQDCYCMFSLCFDIGQFCISSWLGNDVESLLDDD